MENSILMNCCLCEFEGKSEAELEAHIDRVHFEIYGGSEPAKIKTEDDAVSNSGQIFQDEVKTESYLQQTDVSREHQPQPVKANEAIAHQVPMWLNFFTVEIYELS